MFHLTDNQRKVAILTFQVQIPLAAGKNTFLLLLIQV